jgi:hypothetical protein
VIGIEVKRRSLRIEHGADHSSIAQPRQGIDDNGAGARGWYCSMFESPIKTVRVGRLPLIS